MALDGVVHTEPSVHLQYLSELTSMPVDQIPGASLKQLAIWEKDFDMQKNYKARNTLLSWMISSGKVQNLGKPYSLEIDSLGLYINIPKGSKDGIHAHLPLREITDEVISGIQSHTLMSPDDSGELISQKSIITQRETVRVEETTRQFVDRILGLEQIGEMCDATGVNIELVSKDPSILFEVEKEKLVTAVLSGKRIPLQLLLAYLDRDTPLQRERAMNLLSIADTLGKEVSGVPTHDALYGFSTAKVSKTRYSNQKVLLQDSKYYEVVKIINTVVNAVDLTADEKNNWCVYWTPWQNEENTFNAAASMSFYHKGAVVDVPFTPERHLSGIREKQKGKILLEGARRLSTPAYTILDSAIRSYRYFLNISKKIREYFDNIDQRDPRELEGLMNTLEDILYSEIRGWDFPLPSFQELGGTEGQETVEKFLHFCEAQYESSIMGMQGDTSFEPYIVPITLDSGYISDCNISEETRYDKDLMASNESFECIEIPSSNTGGLFYASTRLGLMRGKPLISVIGGCGQLDQNMEGFGRTIVGIASKHAANLCVPGTQSGIGNIFGKLRIEYERANPKLKREGKMQMFGITPAEAAHYPKNKNIQTSLDPFAISVPSILIHGTDGWSMGSSYAYFKKMGIFWDQLHSETCEITKKSTEHIIIVGNGGAFTIAELNTALKKGAYPIFVQGTGRFADLASQILLDIDGLGEDAAMIQNRITTIVKQMENNSQLLRDIENPRWWEEIFLFIHLMKGYPNNENEYSVSLEEMDMKVAELLNKAN